MGTGDDKNSAESEGECDVVPSCTDAEALEMWKYLETYDKPCLVETEEEWQQREYPFAVELDDGRSMLEVYGDGKGFYDSLVKATCYSYVRPNDQSWLSNLRFLTPTDGQAVCGEPPPSTKLEHKQAQIDPCERAECCCSLSGYRAFTESDTERLRLTSPSEIPSCPYFIAVSYCWMSWPKDTGLSSCTIATSDGTRSNKASSRLIKYAVHYAASRGLPFIWIDQECIEQSDNIEKQAHINDMDRIFRRASNVIATLTTTIDEWDHLQALTQWSTWALYVEWEGLISFRKLCDRLSDDDWFGRAWTLQENTSAAQHLDFLPPLEIALCKAEFVTISSRVFRGICEPTTKAGKHRLLPLIWMRGYKLEVPHCLQPGKSNRPVGLENQRLNAEQSLRALRSKGIELPEDRISITANVSGYATRLDLMRRKNAGLDNGTCVFAQTLLNGDMSLILAYRYYLDPKNKGDCLYWMVSGVSLSTILGWQDWLNNAHGYAPVALQSKGISTRG